MGYSQFSHSIDLLKRIEYKTKELFLKLKERLKYVRLFKSPTRVKKCKAMGVL